MGTASSIGSLASIITFGSGLLIGVNLPLPWPMTWAAGITLGVVLSATASTVFEYIDHRKRYSVNAFGTHVTHDVTEGVEVEDCFVCSGADRDGYKIEWAKDEVVAGMVTERHGGGVSYYCGPCHTDDIEAGIRTGRERDFRERYDGEDHWLEALSDLRGLYLETTAADGIDFWEMVDAALARVEDAKDDLSDPRQYVSAVYEYQLAENTMDFWSRVEDVTGVPRSELKERFEDRGWFQHIKSDRPFAIEDDATNTNESEDDDLDEAREEADESIEQAAEVADRLWEHGI